MKIWGKNLFKLLNIFDKIYVVISKNSVDN